MDEYVYIGVVSNFNGMFNKAITKEITQGKKAYFTLLNKIRRLRLPVDLSLQLFDCLVLPVLLYACEVWGFGSIEQIEIIYRKFIKTLLKINLYTPNVMVYGETGTSPVVNVTTSRMICSYARIFEWKKEQIIFHII